MLNPRKELFIKLIQQYDKQQLIVAIEELSELQKELCKSLRGKPNIEAIKEELADVWIMFQQIKLYFGIESFDIQTIVDEKLQRTKERCFGQENENRTN
jgi:NTP pyrophosphatase (non-canonical NTP hydrolase)